MTRWSPKPWQTRFWAKVDKDAPNGCWEWTGHRSAGGYGQFNTQDPAVRTRFAHRIAYLLVRGELPPFHPSRAELDHLCRNTSCLNPDHLEPVEHATNLQRGAQGVVEVCKNGHLYTAANTYRYPVGNRGKRGPTRDCRTCRRERMARWKERTMAQVGS